MKGENRLGANASTHSLSVEEAQEMLALELPALRRWEEGLRGSMYGVDRDNAARLRERVFPALDALVPQTSEGAPALAPKDGSGSSPSTSEPAVEETNG